MAGRTETVMKQLTKQDGVKASEELRRVLTALQRLSASREHAARQHASGRQALERQHILALLSAETRRQTNGSANFGEPASRLKQKLHAPPPVPRPRTQAPRLPEHREHFGHLPDGSDLVFDNLLARRSCIG